MVGQNLRPFYTLAPQTYYLFLDYYLLLLIYLIWEFGRKGAPSPDVAPSKKQIKNKLTRS